MPANPTDAEYVQQTLRGNTQAFGYLVDRHKNAVYGAAFAQLGDFSDAQDIAQEAFLIAYRKLFSLKHPARFSNWLYSIVRNLCYDHLRTQKITQTLDENQQSHVSNPSEEHDRRTLHRRVQKAINTLSKIHRETITLHYIQGYTLREISNFLSVPTGTIKRRLSDARHQLKQEMIDMVRDMFDAHQLPANFHKVVVDDVDEIAKTERAKLYVRDQNKHGFTIEVVGHQHLYIDLKLAKRSLPRPMTYDFMRDICTAFRIELSRVNLTQDNANLIFLRGKKQLEISTSPGYALALALEFDTPVYSDKALLKKTPKKTRKTQSKKSPSITPDPPQIAIEEPNDRPDNIDISLEIITDLPFGKLPTKRARVRRLGTYDLTHLNVTHISTHKQNPN
ncbi:MAG: DUF151 domain-containing protein, partial [Candidatus Latescibacteria bacterium]|nr:DUF151 domain-containing protein [Candidatus Latescibacterota bacterium]